MIISDTNLPADDVVHPRAAEGGDKPRDAMQRAPRFVSRADIYGMCRRSIDSDDHLEFANIVWLHRLPRRAKGPDYIVAVSVIHFSRGEMASDLDACHMTATLFARRTADGWAFEVPERHELERVRTATLHQPWRRSR